MPQRGLLSQFTLISTQTDVGPKKYTPMIVGMSANLLSRRAASPDLGRRAFGVWAFAAIGSPLFLARAATLPRVASLRFGPHPPLEADGRGFVAGLAKSGFHVGENILLAQHDCQGSNAIANTLSV